MQARSLSLSSPIFLPYFSHAGWEKYGRTNVYVMVKERRHGSPERLQHPLKLFNQNILPLFLLFVAAAEGGVVENGEVHLAVVIGGDFNAVPIAFVEVGH